MIGIPAMPTVPPSSRVAVVGAGPAGLMAAEVLATAGAPVTVYDRMPSAGRKFLLAGRSGLNLTHSEPLERLLGRYGAAEHRLAAAVEAFGPDEVRAWAAGLGAETFVGSSGRVFPEGLRATPLLRAWLRRLGDLGVELRPRHQWQGWSETGALLFTDRLTGGRPPDDAARTVEVEAAATVLALGGASWPRVGADGAWVAPVEAAGVAVSPLRPANCGFRVGWSEPFRRRFAGTPVKNVRLSHAGATVPGDLMITATGLEGGPLYALSASLRDGPGPPVLTIDLRPDRNVADLTQRLARRRPGDSTANALRRAWGLTPAAVGLLREATGNRLPDDPAALAGLAKALPLPLLGPEPIERVISTAGGVALDELDDTFMLRRRPGTFVAGEMLDWEAPTGGYLLQACFSTGVAAARGALAWLGR